MGAFGAIPNTQIPKPRDVATVRCSVLFGVFLIPLGFAGLLPLVIDGIDVYGHRQISQMLLDQRRHLAPL